MDLGSLSHGKGANRPRKRLGRGPGSGQGKTAGRGHKGRGARSGGNTPPGYEGGQMPLQRRLPKRGFRNPFRREYAVVNLCDLEERFEPQSVVDIEALIAKRLVRGGQLVKILAQGELHKPLTVKAHAFSGVAKERIAAAGGQAEVIARA
jgi:large subunit ribosomal protein L15